MVYSSITSFGELSINFGEKINSSVNLSIFISIGSNILHQKMESINRHINLDLSKFNWFLDKSCGNGFRISFTQSALRTQSIYNHDFTQPLRTLREIELFKISTRIV